MSWVTIIWAMIASACLTLALVHVLVWWRQREARANLLFALTAVGTAVFAGCELWMMRAETPGAFGAAVRWAHVPVWVLSVSLVGFVRLYLRAGRLWLAWTVCGVRTLSLILNFVCAPNLNYREITALRHVPFLGETVVVGEGVRNPWMLIGQLGLLLLVIFVADAAITVWQRGDRRLALVAGSIVFFVVTGAGQGVLALWGIVHAPIIASLFFMGIVAAMAYELSQNVLRASRLSDDLRDSEERMSLAAEAANLGMWVWDVVRDEVWMTDKGRVLFGFAPNTHLDHAALLARVHPEDRAARDSAIRRAIETQGEYAMEYRVLLPDGTLRWIGARGRCMKVGDTKGTRLLGVSMDVTAQKQAVEALRESEARFRTMANTAPVMIWMSGTDKLCTFFNKGWLDFTGRPLERELGNGWAEGVHGEDFDRCFEVYVNSFDARQAFTMEYRLRRRDGEYRWVLDNGMPRLASDGTFLGYIGSCVDITELKRAEAEARQHREEIAHLSRVAIMGEIAGSLAHELNQPLGAIVTNAGAALRFLERDSLRVEKLREVLQDIVADGRRAGEVIRTIKGMGRKEQGAKQLLDLNDVIGEVLRLTRSDSLAHDCTILTDLSPALPKVEANLVQLQEVFLNLLVNAFEALKEVPRVQRRVVIRTERDGNGALRASVRDFGTGLPADMPERVFDRFFSTKREGMGIGLFIARSIVVAHGGTLWAENPEGGGAQFWLRLPASKEIGV
jgi:two-component system, LuxR family, sensor kinase FixL